MKTKEEKNRKYLIGWNHKVNLIWGEKEQGMKERAELSLCLVIDLPDIPHSGLEGHLQGEANFNYKYYQRKRGMFCKCEKFISPG